jgi:hypothetical protein
VEAAGGDDEVQPQPLDMAFPRSGLRKQITYLLLFPIILPLWLTLPDTRRQSCEYISRQKRLTLFFPLRFIGRGRRRQWTAELGGGGSGRCRCRCYRRGRGGRRESAAGPFLARHNPRKTHLPSFSAHYRSLVVNSPGHQKSLRYPTAGSRSHLIVTSRASPGTSHTICSMVLYILQYSPRRLA